MSRIAGTMLIIFVTLDLCFGLAAESVEGSAGEEITNAVETESPQQKDEKDSAKTSTELGRTSSAGLLNSVRTVSFYLLNGRSVAGRLVSEDKNQVTVEELDESRIFVSTYSKKEIDSRTIHQAKMPEVKYYLDLAEYFESRIWDFKDDPDDFMHAIRFYKKAGEIIEQSQERIPISAAQIEDKIKELSDQKNLWTENATTRARLKRLEFEATFDVRLQEIDDKIDEFENSLHELNKRFDGLVKTKQDNYGKLEKSLSRMNRTLNSKLKEIEFKIELNEREIDRLWRRRRRYPRFYPDYYRLPRTNNPATGENSSEQAK
jgi:hypothetical protein